MRKLLLPALAIAALIIACENKAPTGPGGVGPGGVTVSLTTTTTTTSTTTTVPATTTVSSTTTSVTGSASRRYIQAGGAPNVPSDMQLLFQLLTGTLAPTSLLERLPVVGPAFATATEIRYKVTGTYVMPNGTTGTVDGDLFGPTDPLQNGGEFHGVLTATVGGCTAERVFRGPMGPFSMNLQGGEMVRDCPGSPLAFSAVTMTQSNAPPPPTTSIAAACTFTVSPPSSSAAATASTVPVTVTASATTCTWTAQALIEWLGVAPASGTGSGSVLVSVGANTNGPARRGTLLIAGQVVTIEQQAPTATPDLVPAPLTVSSSGPQYCDFDTTLGTVVRAYTRNVGLGPTTVQSVTTLFLNETQTTLSQPVGQLNPGGQVLLTFQLPLGCFNVFRECQFRLTVDGTNVVFEGSTSADTNNFVDGSCFGGGGVGAASRIRTVVR
jgi:hypothetical protein